MENMSTSIGTNAVRMGARCFIQAKIKVVELMFWNHMQSADVEIILSNTSM